MTSVATTERTAVTIIEDRVSTTTLPRSPAPPAALPSPVDPGYGTDRRSPVELLRLAQGRATEALAWHDTLAEPLVDRSYELVEWNDEYEIWVIHWPAGGHIELHDHGGSSGAFWVVAGTLEETSVTGRGSLQRHDLSAGGGGAFGPRYVHDVRNDTAAVATSVHAYSPPLSSMRFFDNSAGSLTLTRTEYRADPTWAP